MADRREQIIARLLVIAAAVDGIKGAWRNRADISEKSRPAMLILDADEQAEEGDPGRRPANTNRRIRMSPEIYILLGAAPEDVGAEINALRVAFLKAVLNDATLLALTLNGEGVRYEGCATGLARGRTMEAEMGLSFTFSYLLKPSEL